MKIIKQHILQTNLSQYNTIIVFGGEGMMSDLSVKLKEETTPLTDIVSCRFPLDPEVWDTHSMIEDGHNPLWRYKQKSN